MSQVSHWKADDYEKHGRFVSRLGLGVVELLNPQPGERILDLGCGDGALTMALVEAGAEVVGVDSSPSFLEAARARGLDARFGDGHALDFDQEFDAVFSNAALHWMMRPREVAEGIHRALKPGGRFVAEMGGHGNIAAIRTAIRASILSLTGEEVEEPKYFPTDEEHRELLESTGFVVDQITLFPRPTPLPGDMESWLKTFAGWMDAHVPGQEDEARKRASRLLETILRDKAGKWTADYVRLRFAARKA